MTRATRVRRRLTGAGIAAAAAAGATLRTAPGLFGAAAVSYGVFQIYAPAGWIAAGAFLLLVDRRVP